MNDKMKMKRHAAKLKAAEARKAEALAEVVGHAKNGLLTREEAAQCLAGAMLKVAEEMELPGAAGLEYAQLLVDQALDGDEFPGLAVGRHV